MSLHGAPGGARTRPWVAAMAPAMALGLALGLALAGCATVNPYHDASRPHHRPDGFNNLHLDNWRADAPSFWKWQWERLGADLAADQPERIGRVPLDARRLHANLRDVTVTWIGHSTVLWQVNGLNILTDPHFGPRASPVSFAGPQRKVPLPTTLAELPRIDVVLLSHNHYDHLDQGTVLALNAQRGGPPLFVV
ncbi:MAG: MBL fold metallo-hydrolase, partial [Curvibacter sp.]